MRKIGKFFDILLINLRIILKKSAKLHKQIAIIKI